jgi:signal transduction histidine kinase
MRVLVVEDELKMASLLRRGLLEEGHAADIARTGDDALTAAARAADGTAAGELHSREGEGFAQMLATDGSLVASSPSVASRPLVDAGEVQRARSESVYLRRENVPGLDGGPARLLVEQVDGREGPVVLVVGASLEDRDDALDRLQGQLLLVGPLALVLSSFAGYLLAAAALRPVEAMRKRAAEVSAVRTGQRLPLPKARDELRRLGETLNDMLARLETALSHERRFVADASHELRTPLALLQTELELALRRPRSREALEQALRSGAEEVDRLVRLAEDLLVLARGDEDRLPLHAGEVPAGDILDSVAGRSPDGRPTTGDR